MVVQYDWDCDGDVYQGFIGDQVGGEQYVWFVYVVVVFFVVVVYFVEVFYQIGDQVVQEDWYYQFQWQVDIDCCCQYWYVEVGVVCFQLVVEGDDCCVDYGVDVDEGLWQFVIEQVFGY